MTAVASGVGRAAPARSIAPRLIAALPLVTVFTWLMLVYAWQAWLVTAPIIFTDELLYTELARSLASELRPELRGQPTSLESLTAAFRATAWLLDDVGDAYLAAKLIGVVAMTASVFPAYALARMLVAPRLALFAAAGSIAIPALSYSALLMEEPFAYPLATLALYLIVRALAARTPLSAAAAIAACLVAPFVRGQLVVLAAVLLLATLLVAGTDERVRRRLARWRPWHWPALAVAAVVVAVAGYELLTGTSDEWQTAAENLTGTLDYGIWALGALTIGVGVLPVVASLAGLVPARRERQTRERTAFAAVLAASVVVFGVYAAVKGIYLSTFLAALVLERNVIYLAPLLFVGTALWLQRPRVHPVALVAAATLVAAVVQHAQVVVFHPYFEAPGYSIVALAYRELGLTEHTIELLLWVAVAVSAVVVAGGHALAARPRRLAALAAVVAPLVLAWNVTGEVYAAVGQRDLANRMLASVPAPVDWLDRATRGRPALYLGQGIDDPNRVHLLEFWNRSLEHVWSLDGTAPGPGPTVMPTLTTPDGSLSPDPGVAYVVTEAPLELEGTLVKWEGGWRLYRIRAPLRLRSAVTGVFSDGWMGASSAYSQFRTPGMRPGRMEVDLGRAGWGGTDVPARATIRVGRLAIGPGALPTLGRVTAVRTWTLRALAQKTFRIPTPAPPFRVEVTVSPTFVPGDLDPRSGDRRKLGAQVAYRFVAAGRGVSR